VRRVETPGAGGVEQAQVAQQRRRVRHLDAPGRLPAGGPGVQVVHDHRVGGARRPRPHGPVAGHEPQVGGGGDGRVDRGQARHPEQRVDQRTLAAFGFADHHDLGADQVTAAQVGQFGAGVRVGGTHVRDGVAHRRVQQRGQVGHRRTCWASR
jgi:hypothetical protein